MTITTTIPFVLNLKPGVVSVNYEPNQSAAKSGFDLFAGSDFDVEICIVHPTMRARIESYEGTGYCTASAWIQVVTRREFASVDALEPAMIIPSVDHILPWKNWAFRFLDLISRQRFLMHPATI